MKIGTLILISAAGAAAFYFLRKTNPAPAAAAAPHPTVAPTNSLVAAGTSLLGDLKSVFGGAAAPAPDANTGTPAPDTGDDILGPDPFSALDGSDGSISN